MNRNRIAIARGSAENLAKSKEKLASGQPVYNYDKRYLTVGQNKADVPNNEKTYPNSKTITVRDMIGWFADNSKLTGSMQDADKYYVVPTETGLSVFSSKMLDLEATSGININSNTKVDDSKKLTVKNLITNLIDSNADKIVIKENGEKTFEINRITNINKNIKFAENTGVHGKFQVVSAKDASKYFSYNEDGLLKNAGNLEIEGDSKFKGASNFTGNINAVNLNSAGIISVDGKLTTGYDEELKEDKLHIERYEFGIAGNVSMNKDGSSFTKPVTMESLNVGDTKVTGNMTVTNLVIN